MGPSLKAEIERQRTILNRALRLVLAPTASVCAATWSTADKLDAVLAASIAHLPGCKLLYALDTERRQVSANVTDDRIESSVRGQDLSVRPFLLGLAVDAAFHLSPVYVSRVDRQPCVTALHRVQEPGGAVLGFVAADFALDSLPSTNNAALCGSSAWRQIKGDPAIRQNLFLQERVHSAMDERLEEVHDTVVSLMAERGIFHAKLHYGSSRATLWLYDDPHNYRLHVLDEITDPSVCLAYPRAQYAERAKVPRSALRDVFGRMARLRLADSTLYLRSGSLNVINGMVGLTFSCDGSHYMPVDEFLGKDDRFWFGAA